MSEHDLLQVGAILEVSAEYEEDLGALLYGPCDFRWDAIYLSGHYEEEVTSVREALNDSSFKGWEVQFVDMPSIHDEEPTHVPHFDHGAGVCERDESGDLSCDTEGKGVIRLFGLNMTITPGEDAEERRNLLKNFRVMPGVRVKLSGLKKPSGGEKTEREEVAKKAPEPSGLPEEWFSDMNREINEYEERYDSDEASRRLTEDATDMYRREEKEPPYSV